MLEECRPNFSDLNTTNIWSCIIICQWGIKPGSPAKAQTPNHWTTRELPGPFKISTRMPDE